MTRVKICGIQELDHALVAAQAGADFIGLVFVPRRRRRLEVSAARAIVSGLKTRFDKVPKVVGLFADQPLEEVNRVIRACQLDVVQLCGQEPLDYCRQVDAEVIKVLRVANPPNPPLQKGGGVEIPPFDKGGTGGISVPTETTDGEDLTLGRLAQEIQYYREAGHLVTLDRLVEGLQGGTGQSFDWEVAAQLSRQGHSFLLAGGLTPANVAQAIATVRPWGVDVSSGVETGGIKDPEKIKAFVRCAKQSTI